MARPYLDLITGQKTIGNPNRKHCDKYKSVPCLKNPVYGLNKKEPELEPKVSYFLKQGRPTPLTEKSAKALLKRMLISKGNEKYELSLDQRLKNYVTPLQDDRYIIETITETPVQCPILIVFGIDHGVQRKVIRPILNTLKKQKNVTVIYVPGHHDVHSNDPERVAPHVERFLNLQKNKL